MMTSQSHHQPRSDRAQYDLVVLGGGLLGSTIALFCARGGMKVALVDRGPIFREASGVNAGTLTLHMTRVALIPYALGGHKMWETASEWLGHDVGVNVCDGLSLAFTEKEEQILLERAALRREAGAPIETISKGRAKEVEPGLSDHVRVAAFSKVDGYASAYLTGLAYRRALLAADVDIIEGTKADTIEQIATGYCVHANRDGSVIKIEGTRLAIAAGVWTEKLLQCLGIKLPIKTLINQLAVTERTEPLMCTVVGIASGLLSLKQFPNGTTVIGGGWQGIGDRDGGRGTPSSTSLVGNIRLACHAIPALRQARMVRAWTGYEAETPDALPLASDIDGFENAYVCASVHSGYTSGLYIARLLAERILDCAPADDLFPISRFFTNGTHQYSAESGESSPKGVSK